MTGRPFPGDFELLLASQSPRRRELLASVGVPHRVVPSSADEELEGAHPRRLVEANALAKARSAVVPRPLGEGTFILGSDTIVVVDGQVLGKAMDRAEARSMLTRLSGRPHEVVSGIALLRGEGNEVVGHAGTTVGFRALEAGDIEAYLDSGEWIDKAGAYAIQGLAALAVEGIQGDYTTVVGLPLALLGRLFRESGFDLLTARWL